MDSDTPFSMIGIAERTGLTLDVVRATLNSPVYHELMRNEAQQLFEHAMTRAIRKLDEIVHGEKSKNMERIAASTAIGRLYDAARKPGQTPPQSPAEKALDEWERRHQNGAVPQ